MTLIPYDAHRLDQLALRTLDIACHLRTMAETCRAEGLAQFELHDKKASEWLAKLELWSHDAQLRLRKEIYRRRGEKAGRESAERVRGDRTTPPPKPSANKAARGKSTRTHSAANS